MQKKELPIDFANAEILTVKKASNFKFVMKRMEDIFDYFSEEPLSINVNKDDEYTCFFRIRIWNRKKCYSWSIYSQDRECLERLIIRRVVWDSEKDEGLIKKSIKDDREAVQKMCPSISICNKIISISQSDQIIRLIYDLDLELEKGVSLEKNKKPTWEWRDLEVLRLYDWGQIHLIWSTDRRNERIENKVKDLIAILNLSLEREKQVVAKMDLIYSVDPEEYE